MQTILKFTCLFILIGLLHVRSLAQSAKRILNATEVKQQLIIDGKLSEPVWQQADAAGEFVQTIPRPGYSSVQHTSVRVLYDDNAVYVGAMMYDSSPDSILHQLTARDDYEYSNTDAIGVTFDTYCDRQNATLFVVTAAGVQTDGIVKFDNTDLSWNAAWYSRVTFNDSGWSVEMKIPYSAIRFPKKDVQQWGINFFRVIRRIRERSYWNTVDPAKQNIISQSGTLNGIHSIQSPVRLALLPYVSAYGENYAGSNAHSFNGGMDIKYGLTESFTLDMTLVPDFGQTLFDNKVLNLSPIEVRYDERRYFFTEGVDLFNKNDLFYSRRVGGTPVNFNKATAGLDSNEIIDKNPLTTKLYNATKISGRTRHNLGIGFFNAVAAPAYATVVDTITNSERKLQTAPLTNYNVLVLDQALKNNSYISFVNTNVSRADNNYNADVTALLFRFANKANRYGVSGSGDISQLYNTQKTDVGYRYYLEAAKLSGNYTFSLNARTISDRFNPNDLGYLDRNNISTYVFDHYYKTYKPFGIINSTYNHAGITYNRVFNPDVFSRVDLYGSHNITFTSFHTAGVYWEAQPLKSYDYYEPRVPGRFYLYPENYIAGGFVSSDYRRKFAIDLESNNKWFGAPGRSTLYLLFSPRYRFSDKFSAVYRFEQLTAANDVGFVGRQNDSVFLGTRNVNTIINTLTADYIFTATMSLKLNARHYWSQAEYSLYSLLSNDGLLNNAVYTGKHDINYNSFNVFLNFVWQFKPGSELSVVYQNSIYALGDNIITNYFSDAGYTLQSPQSNSLSVKMIYYLDYQYMSKMLRGKRKTNT